MSPQNKEQLYIGFMTTTHLSNINRKLSFSRGSAKIAKAMNLSCLPEYKDEPLLLLICFGIYGDNIYSLWNTFQSANNLFMCTLSLFSSDNVFYSYIIEHK